MQVRRGSCQLRNTCAAQITAARRHQACAARAQSGVPPRPSNRSPALGADTFPYQDTRLSQFWKKRGCPIFLPPLQGLRDKQRRDVAATEAKRRPKHLSDIREIPIVKCSGGFRQPNNCGLLRNAIALSAIGRRHAVSRVVFHDPNWEAVYPDSSSCMSRFLTSISFAKLVRFSSLIFCRAMSIIPPLRSSSSTWR